jgi:hypothetical protein
MSKSGNEEKLGIPFSTVCPLSVEPRVEVTARNSKFTVFKPPWRAG